MVNRENFDLLLENKIRMWSTEVVNVVNRALGVEKNLLFDFIPPSSLFAGNDNLLLSKRIGSQILYSFVVKLVSDDCVDLSLPLNRDLCLTEFPKFTNSSPLICRAKFSVEPRRPWKRRNASDHYLDALTAKLVAEHVQCKIDGKWKTMVPTS